MIGFANGFRIFQCMENFRLRFATLVFSCLGLSPLLLGQGSGISVTVSPQNETTYLGTTRQYTATVMGPMNMGVKWAINGVVGGGSTFGYISTAGLYTPPGALPNPPSATVQAISLADGTTMGTAIAKLAAKTTPPPTPPPTPSTTFTTPVSGSGSEVYFRLNE